MVADSQASKNKILVLYDSNLGHATQYVKGMSLAAEYQKNDWEVRFADLHTTHLEEVLQVIAWSNLTYLLKVASLELVQFIKNNTQSKLVFDLADALWMPVHRAVGWTHLEEILRTVDAIFYENSFIGEYGKQFNDNCYYVPVISNVEKFDAVNLLNPEKPNDSFRIGWVGSGGTVQGLINILPDILPLFKKHSNLELRVLGAANLSSEEISLFPARTNFIQSYDEDLMISEISGMHAGLYPALSLEDYVMRGPQKAILYMQGRAVPVALDAGECSSIIEHGKSGMLVRENTDWFNHLEHLISQPLKLREMAAQAALTSRIGRSRSEVFYTLQKGFLEVIG